MGALRRIASLQTHTPPPNHMAHYTKQHGKRHKANINLLSKSLINELKAHRHVFAELNGVKKNIYNDINQLIKFINEPQKLETLLSRFEVTSTVALTVNGAELSWERWLIPELKISMLTISDKEDKLNVAILEDLKVSLG